MNKHVLLATTLAVLTAFAAAPAFAQSGSSAGPSTGFVEQNSGGHAVYADWVELPSDGFLAIHDATLLSGNVLGSVVGVSEFLTAGNHTHVRVYLTRALVAPNETLVAMPHKDSNGNHVYDFVSSGGTQDGPFVGAGPNQLPENALPAALQGKGLGGISAVVAKANVGAYLEAHAQAQSGRSVIVDFVDTVSGGYVALHDATLVATPGPNGINANNLFSSVVGVSDYLAPGIHTDVVVPVGNNCAGCTSHENVTGTLIPMAHKETNGNQAYDFITSQGAQDGAYTGQPGAPLTAVINVIQVSYSDVATETFPAQATGGHLVVFPQVFLPNGGFAAVHDSTLLAGNVLGSVVGVSPFLSAGIHRNVTVELNFAGSAGLNKSDTLIGMLHKDTNGNKAYDFVSSQGAQDGPYTGGPNSLAEGQLPAPLQGKGLGGVNAVPASANLSALVMVPAQQMSDGTSYRVPYADFSQAGYVALHDESLLANPGSNVLTSVVGVSTLQQPGLHKDVVVTLGANCAGCVKGKLNVSQTLIAMPHKETNGNSTYDFITSQGAQDGPFVTGAAASNTVSALNLNIVVSVGRATVPVMAPGANNTTPTPTTSTPATSTPASSTPATSTPSGATPATSTPAMSTPASSTPATSTPASSTPVSSTPASSPASSSPESTAKPTPGFEVVALLGALAVAAAIVLVRRRR